VFDLGTNTWQPARWPVPPSAYGGDNNSSWGVIDPTSDSLYHYFWDGAWGANVRVAESRHQHVEQRAGRMQWRYRN